MKLSSSVFSYIFFSLCSVGAFACFWLQPINFPADDGYFYLQIAQRLAEGKGSSFHDLSETNGYHPLWMVLCSLIANVVGGNKNALFIGSIATQAILFATALYYGAKTWTQEKWLLAAIPLGIIFLGVGTLYLSEAFLAAAVCMAFLQEWEKKTPSWALGVLGGAWILARLDAVFLVGAFALCDFLFRKPKIWQFVLNWLAAPLLLLAYMTFNYYYFGHYMPVSGRIKQGFNLPESWQELLNAETMLLVLSVLGMAIFARKRNDEFALALGSFLHTTYTFVGMRGSGMWYWVPEYILLGLILGEIGQKFFQDWKIYLLAIPALFIPATAYLKATTQLLPHQWLQGKKAITANQDIPKLCAQLEELIPRNGRVLVFDTPGRLAWYSELNIIPSDGLVNSYEYGKELHEKGIEAWMYQNNIHYLLAPKTEIGQKAYKSNGLEISCSEKRCELSILAPIIRQKVKTELPSENLVEIFKSPLAPWKPEYPVLGLWKWK